MGRPSQPESGKISVRASNRRDTETGELLSNMSMEESEAEWARCITKIAEELKAKGGVFDKATAARLRRLTTRVELAHQGELTEDQNQVDLDLESTLDLTDHAVWFKAQLNEKSRKVFVADVLNFYDEKDFCDAVNQDPVLWFKLTRYLKGKITSSDLRIQDLGNQVATLADTQAQSIDEHMKRLNGMRRNRDRYRETIQRQDEELKGLKEQVKELKAQIAANGGDRDGDRAYYPIDLARNTRAALEQLSMGPSESFAEFYPKFHVQINRLKLPEAQRIDELIKCLSDRFANRILDGLDHTYEDLISRCYRLDSQITKWNATNLSRETI